MMMSLSLPIGAPTGSPAGIVQRASYSATHASRFGAGATTPRPTSIPSGPRHGPDRPGTAGRPREATPPAVNAMATPRPPHRIPGLLANLQTPDDVEIPLRRDALEVVEKSTPTAHHLQKATPTGMVLRMLLEVIRQMRDSPGQKRDLDLGRPGVGDPPPMRTDQFLLPFFRQRHRRRSAHCRGGVVRGIVVSSHAVYPPRGGLQP